MPRAQPVLLLLACASAADVTRMLREAMLTEAEVKAIPDIGNDRGILFQIESLGRTIPEEPDLKRPVHERVSGTQTLKRADGSLVGAPGALLDLAFGCADTDDVQHSPVQQDVQVWLFSLCKRLPESGSVVGLRRECSKRVAAYAAIVQRQGIGAVETGALNQARFDAVVALGLGRRSNYLPPQDPSYESESQEAVAKAATLAKKDKTMARLLKKREVVEAMEHIAADPEAIARYRGNQDVMEALARLSQSLRKVEEKPPPQYDEGPIPDVNSL